MKPQAVVPAATVTLAGTLATAGLLLDNATIAPPAARHRTARRTPDVLVAAGHARRADGDALQGRSGGGRRDRQRRGSRHAVVARGDRDRRGRGDGGCRDRERAGEPVAARGRRRDAGDRRVAAGQRDHCAVGRADAHDHGAAGRRSPPTTRGRVDVQGRQLRQAAERSAA